MIPQHETKSGEAGYPVRSVQLITLIAIGVIFWGVGAVFILGQPRVLITKTVGDAPIPFRASMMVYHDNRVFVRIDWNDRPSHYSQDFLADFDDRNSADIRLRTDKRGITVCYGDVSRDIDW
jgi:hypothetical protein